MGFKHLQVNRWGYVTGNANTRPTNAAATGFGTSISCGLSNVKSSYVPILTSASLTTDCYFIAININNFNESGNVKNMVLDIGIDRTGVGTTYEVLIPNLLGTAAGFYGNAVVGDGGIWYYFPLYIPQRSALAARCMYNGASAKSCNVAVFLYGDPSHPHLIQYGTGVEAIGIDTTQTSTSIYGKAVVAGQASEGAWTAIATTQNNCFFWQVGYAALNSNFPSNSRHIDVAADNNANPKMLIDNVLCWSTTTEKISLFNEQDSYCDVPAGTLIYARMQESAAPVATQTVAVWGVY